MSRSAPWQAKSACAWSCLPVPQKEKRDEIHAGLTDGSIHILIGTHAVIEDNVEFRCLGLVIIDEQHRFGVAQRARLWKKNFNPPHVLVMTATPIPRTLAMTVYGDLDVSVIDELPPGRKPIQTILRYENNREWVNRLIGHELSIGRQAYIVFPLIQENEKLELKALEEGFEYIRNTFRSYKVSFVHGKMKPAEKDCQMQLFASKQTQILVATTVIEVGVNVPNASVMVIENAERFDCRSCTSCADAWDAEPTAVLHPYVEAKHSQRNTPAS